MPTRRDALRIAAALALVRPVCARTNLSKYVLWYGRDEAPAKLLNFTAGPVSLQFDPSIAFVRYIRVGGRDVLRGIYSAVRDQSWLTIAPRVHNLKHSSDNGAFTLTFDVECKERDIDFLWHGSVTGQADGTIRYAMDGVARSTFLRNRIGFCVLHPMTCAGQPSSAGTFPDLISPHQPFKNLKSISHSVMPGVEATVEFEGDIFETEDHRNWTDGNFKTYCTPLERPYPVKVEAGTKIAQSVTVRIKGTPPPGPRTGGDIVIEEGARVGKLPEIGVGLGPDVLDARETSLIKALGLSHIRADLRLFEPGWEATVERAAKLGLPVEAAVFVSDEGELARLAPHAAKMRVTRWLVFHRDHNTTPAKLIAAARKHLGGNAKFGGGTNVYFTELNRERPEVAAFDVVSYTINPQVHAFDNASLVENLEAQAHTVRTARSFTRDRWIAVTPVTLRPRFNPAARGPQAEDPTKVPSRIDPRQMSLFGAGWTLGSLKYLAESGANSVTYYEAVGWGGLIERAGGSPLPALFPSTPGQIFPVYQVFKNVLAARNADVVRCTSSDPLSADALLLHSGGRRRWFIANYRPEETVVRVGSVTKRIPPYEIVTV